MDRDDIEAVICHALLIVCLVVAFGMTIAAYGG